MTREANLWSLVKGACSGTLPVNSGLASILALRQNLNSVGPLGLPSPSFPAEVKTGQTGKRSILRSKAPVFDHFSRDPKKGPRGPKDQNNSRFRSRLKISSEPPTAALFLLGKLRHRDWNFRARLIILIALENFERDWIFLIVGPSGVFWGSENIPCAKASL